MDFVILEIRNLLYSTEIYKDGMLVTMYETKEKREEAYKDLKDCIQTLLMKNYRIVGQSSSGDNGWTSLIYTLVKNPFKKS